MNPLRLRAANFKTFRELDLALPTGCVGVVGANGAGKSSVIQAIDVCLFGSETRTLAPYLSDDAVPGDILTLQLELDHSGETYHIRRTFSSAGRGKSTCDFAILNEVDTPRAIEDGFGWHPLTQGDQKETQALIESTLGLTRDTFRASTMLVQGDGSSFCDAPPKQRKEILADALGLDVWDRGKDLIGRDRRVREQMAHNLDGRLSFLAERAAEHEQARATVTDLSEQADTTTSRTGELADRAAAARERHSELQGRAQAALTARAHLGEANAEHAALAREQEQALTAANSALAIEQDMPRLQARATELAAVEAERETLAEQRREQERKRAHATALAAELHSVVSARQRAAEALTTTTAHHNATLERIEEIHTRPSTKCDRCEQELGGRARDRAIESHQKEAADYAARAKRAEGEEHDLAEREQQLRAELEKAGEESTDTAFVERDAALTVRYLDLQTARETLAAAAERLAGLQAAAAIRDTFVDELAAAEANIRARERALAELDEPSPAAVEESRVAAQDAERGVAAARSRAEDVGRRLAHATAQLELIAQAARDHQQATAERELVERDLEELRLLERAFGRDGVPTWILETSAIPSLELEADRLLAALGTDYRVELRTERELKSGGGAAETLDVILLTPSGARDYSTFSGGERTRLNLALRLALARLLAHRRGAESRALIIDEPEFLDQAGTEFLVDALRGMDGEFDRILLVSHVPALRDAFDTTLQVTKTDGRSEVLAA